MVTLWSHQDVFNAIHNARPVIQVNLLVVQPVMVLILYYNSIPVLALPQRMK